jgi:hypothetical protein
VFSAALISLPDGNHAYCEERILLLRALTQQNTLTGEIHIALTTNPVASCNELRLENGSWSNAPHEICELFVFGPDFILDLLDENDFRSTAVDPSGEIVRLTDDEALELGNRLESWMTSELQLDDIYKRCATDEE